MQIAQRLVNPPTGYQKPRDEVPTEYPKWLHFSDKPSVLVRDKAEESRVMAGEVVQVKAPLMAPEEVPVPNLVGKNDEREMLLKIAEENGIKVDGRWNLKKLRSKVEAAFPQE